MNRTVIAVVLVGVSLLALSQSQSPTVNIPQLPTQLDDFGARPGSFHFVTNERAMENMTELKKTFAVLDAIDSEVARMDPAVRKRLSPQLAELRAFANGIHAQQSESASKTAGQVEVRLNEAKGKFMCGACHGHGMGMMMHGRGMGMGMRGQ